jgi:hypothetical protein
VPASQKRVSLKAASTPAKAVEKGPSRRKDAVIDIDMDMDVDGDVDMDTPKRVLALAAPTTPAPMTSASERRQPARVTPWLGTTRKSESSRSASTSTSRRGATTVDFSDDEEDDVPPLRQGVHTPLVRDRTGSMGGSTGSTNLRRRALQRRAAETPDTSTKRKADDTLDHSLLSPAERARVRKQLSRLSTAERRELYAPYKGKGRYVAPAQLNRTAADEFEVDPEKNGGVGHQFHEVVRNRAERRKMHGGDCECCRDVSRSRAKEE